MVEMFFVHPAVAWMAPASKQGTYFETMRFISGMVAPVFLTLAGIAIAIIAEHGRKKSIDEHQLKRRVTTRGVEVWAIGYGLHLFMYLMGGARGHWQQILKVDILHCIGASLVIFPWVAWPRHRLNLAALLFALLIPFAAMLLFRLPVEDVLPVGVSGYFKTNAPMTQFALIPYATWVAFGLFIGPLLLAGLDSPRKERRFWIAIVVAAVALYAASRGMKWLFYHFELNRLGTEVPQVRGLPFVFWMKGAFVLVALFFFRITAPAMDRLRRPVLVLLGQTSLFAYCVHLVIVYSPLGSLLRHRLTALEHFASCIALFAVMVLLSLAWVRVRPRLRRRRGRV